MASDDGILTEGVVRTLEPALTNSSKKTDVHGTTDRRPGTGSSRPKYVRTRDNIAIVQDLICSQDDAPHTHKSLCSMWRPLS